MYSNAAVRLDNVGVTFRQRRGSFTALSGVDLQIEQGEFVALLGPSGCGKSTLLRVLSDLVPTSSGTVSVLGATPAEARARRDVGFVFQDSALLPWRRVIDNVRLPQIVGPPRVRRSGGMSPDDALELVGLSNFRDAYPRQLSGGMKQRVSIARALVTNPKVLLMDEPFGALDEITRDKLNVELLRIWEQSDTTIVFVTHSIPEAAFLAQRVVVMAAGPGRVHEEITVPVGYPRELDQRDQSTMQDVMVKLRTGLEGK